MDGGTAAGATNNTSTFVTYVLPVISAVLGGGGLLVSAFTYFITKKKTNAEVKKLEAETREINLRIDGVTNITGTLGYKASNTQERVIFDSTKENIGFGFPKGTGEFIWTRGKGKSEISSGRGEGSMTIEDGKVMTIKRDNTDGRFEMWLTRYQYDGEVKNYIPPELGVSQRIFRVNFKARAVKARFKLKLVFKNEETDTWPASVDVNVTEEDWTNFELYFPVAPTEKCRFRIDNIGVSQAPSYLQIRDIVLTEKSD
jgi:hypothetical protein